MSNNGLVHHEINYIEISARDIGEAKQFYSAAFGWEFTDYGPQYCGIKKVSGDGEVGGICHAEEIKTGGPLVVLYSNDLESSHESVTRAGGTMTTEILSFPGGRRFQFLDPSGNELAVWSDQTPTDS